METTAHTLEGRVTSEQNYTFRVDCPAAPAHLRPLYLEARLMKGAVVGNDVRLIYLSSSSYGMWVVSEVLR